MYCKDFVQLEQSNFDVKLMCSLLMIKCKTVFLTSQKQLAALFKSDQLDAFPLEELMDIYSKLLFTSVVYKVRSKDEAICGVA